MLLCAPTTTARASVGRGSLPPQPATVSKTVTAATRRRARTSVDPGPVPVPALRRRRTVQRRGGRRDGQFEGRPGARGGVRRTPGDEVVGGRRVAEQAGDVDARELLQLSDLRVDA